MLQTMTNLNELKIHLKSVQTVLLHSLQQSLGPSQFLG